MCSMNKIASILILLSLFLGNAFAQDSMSFGNEDQGYGGQGGGYDNQGGGGYGNQGGQQGQNKGGTGLERKNLNDSMKVMDKTDLTESEVCKTKCNMGFSNCYRLKSDRGQCYKDQQECLGKCGGEQEVGFGEDPSGGQGGGEYGF